MPAKGFFELYPEMRPVLTAGPYLLATDHDLVATPPDNDPGELAVDGSDFTFRVVSPRYTMPPDQILSTFPPATAVGDWRDRLPQIVFKRRTLPWERNPDPAGTETPAPHTKPPPWLALVVLAEGEFSMSAGSVPVAQCVSSDVTLPDPADADTATGRYLEVRSSVVQTVFPTVEDLYLLNHVRRVDLGDTELALNDDDGYLAVTIANRLPQPGPPIDPADPNSPLTSIKYTACLINVESQLAKLPDVEESDTVFDNIVTDLIQAEYFTEPPDLPPDVIVMQGPAKYLAAPKGPAESGTTKFAGSAALGIEAAAASYALGPVGDQLAVAASSESHLVEVWQRGDALGLVGELMPPFAVFDPVRRFPVLATWDFVCTGGGNFETLMAGLDSGLIGTTDIAVDPALRPNVPPVSPELRPETAATGHIGLGHTTRQGESARSWYRGPLVPQPTVRAEADPVTHVLPVHHTGDQLRRVVPDGREDVGLAAAFEIGRLLALSQQSIVAKMMAWREELFGAARLKAVTTEIFEQLVPGFADAMLQNRGALEELIAGRVLVNYAGTVTKVFGDPAPPFAASRLPDVVAETRPADVLTGFGLDAGQLRTATKEFGLAGLASLAPVLATPDEVPVSESPAALDQLRSDLGAHLDGIAADALGKVTGAARIDVDGPIPHGAGRATRGTRRRDALDRMIERANARRTEEERR